MRNFFLIVMALAMCAPLSVAKNRFKGLMTNVKEISGETVYMYERLADPIMPYIVETSDGVWMRVKLIYERSSWLFFDEIYLKGAGELRKINFTKSEKDNKVLSGGYVREMVDVLADNDLVDYLDRFRNDKEARVVFVAQGQEVSRSLSYEAKYNLKNVFNAWEILVGEKGQASPNTSVVNNITPPCFYNVRLGMGVDDVKDIEESTLMTSMSNDAKLIYNASIYGNGCFVSYDFENGKLKSILVLFNSPSKSSGEIFDSLLGPMRDYYGTPSSVTSSSVTWIRDGEKINLLNLNNDATIFILPVTQ